MHLQKSLLLKPKFQKLKMEKIKGKHSMKRYWKGYGLYIITNMFWHKSFQNICLMRNSERAAEQDETN